MSFFHSPYLFFFSLILFFTMPSGSGSMDKPEQTAQQHFADYSEKIPGSDVQFTMIAIKGGRAAVGSPDTEKGHKKDEGPVHQVELDPFWIGKCEVTWDEFEQYVYAVQNKNTAKSPNAGKPGSVKVDAVATPTPPFTDMSFGMGKQGFPAVNMTQYAAMGYCKWLTDKTGHFYRLPTEAEWEYACRAGSSSAYSFGDQEAQLSEYAWYVKNSGERYHKVATRKPNAWGLYDMHGNVSEWTLDQYNAGFYQTPGAVKKNAWLIPSALHPRTVRGGSWDDDATDLRSAVRRGSGPGWKKRDPQIPKSDWWNTDASFVGFRIVRPLKQPSGEEIRKYFSKPIKDM